MMTELFISTTLRLLLKNNKCAMFVKCIVLQALSYVLGLLLI